MLLSVRSAVLLAAVVIAACGPVRPPSTGFADLPMAGLESTDETPLVRLAAEPGAFVGKTVRTRVRVAEARREPRGILLWVVPAGAPIEARGQRLLFPAGSGGEELLDLRGRDLVLVMRVTDVVSTPGIYEPAVVAEPISHLSLFGLGTDGGPEAAALREQLEQGAPSIGDAGER